VDLTCPSASLPSRPFAAACIALACAVFAPVSAFAAPEEPATEPATAEPATAESAPSTGGESAAVETAPGESVTGEGVEAARSRTLTRELAEQGESELNKAVRVFQQRYLVKRHRLELQVGGGMTVSDQMVTHYSADAGLFFHFTDQFAFGVTASKYTARDSTASGAVENNFGLFAERSHLQAGGMAEVQWSPLFGKFAVFGLGVVQVDGYLLAGGGVERTTRGTDLKPAGEIGIGMRLHMLRWLSLSADIRDVIYQEKFLDCDSTSYSGVCASVTMNQWFAGVRLGIWIPFTSTYRFPR
jgi:outer membrane beta-barrel protein